MVEGFISLLPDKISEATSSIARAQAADHSHATQPQAIIRQGWAAPSPMDVGMITSFVDLPRAGGGTGDAAWCCAPSASEGDEGDDDQQQSQ